jgi:signal transduction histidine kinase
MRFLTLLFGLAISTGQLAAAPRGDKPIPDSLSLKLTQAKSDRESVDLLNAATPKLREREMKQAVMANAQALALAQRIGYIHGNGVAHNHLTVLLMFQNQYDSALMVALKAKEMLQKSNDLRELSYSYNNIGVIYKFRGDYKSSMDHHTQALRLRERTNDTTGISLSYNNIGDIYAFQKNYRPALENYRQALKYSQLANDHPRMIINYVDIGRVWQQMGKAKEALEYYLAAIELGQKHSPTYKIAEVKAYVAELYAIMNEPQRAIQYLEQAVSAVGQAGNIQNQMLVFYQAAVVYAKLGRNQQAIDMAAQSIGIAQQSDNKALLRDANQLLFEQYLQRKDWEKTLFYQQQFARYRDELLAAERNQELVQKEAFFELEQEKRKNELIRKDNELREARNQLDTLVWVAVGLAFGFLLTVLGFLYQQNRREKRNNVHLTRLNQELTTRKDEIKQLHDYLEQLVTERTNELSLTIDRLTAQNLDLQQFSFILSHNIRSPIAQMTGLVELGKMEPDNPGLHREIMAHMERAAQNLHQVVSDLSEILTIRRGMEHTQESTSLREVLAQVLLVLESEIARSGAVVHTDFSGGEHVLAVKSYVQSVIYNLLSNAIKYRSPQRQAQISFRTEQTEGWLGLVVTDNGLGIDLKNTDPYKIFGLYQRMHTHTEGKGLGLYMVKAQVEAMKGKIELASALDQGTEFRVYLPMAAQPQVLSGKEEASVVG